MQPHVDIAPGAEDNPLALYFAERIRGAIASGRELRAFTSLAANVRAVDFDDGRAVSLRFDHGRLAIHDGAIGVPTVTLGGPRRALESLHRLSLRDLPRALFVALRQGGIGPGEASIGTPSPPPISSGAVPPSTRGTIPPPPIVPLEAEDLLTLLGRGELRVYGGLTHPRVVTRFLRLLVA